MERRVLELFNIFIFSVSGELSSELILPSFFQGLDKTSYTLCDGHNHTVSVDQTVSDREENLNHNEIN